MPDLTKKTREEIIEWNRVAHKKVHPRLTQKDVYEDLMIKIDFDLGFKEYDLLMSKLNEYLMHYLINTGNRVLLPFFLGTLQVIRKETKGSKIDFDYFKKTGEKRVHKNKHSEKYYAKIFWNRSSKRYHNKWYRQLFLFRPNRLIRADLAKAIKTNNTIYKYDLK